jgi:hypothetical protein
VYVAAIVVGVAAYAVGLPLWVTAVVALIALFAGAGFAAWMFAVAARPPGAHVAAAPEVPSTPTPTFRPEGEYWTVTLHGPTFRLAESKGLRYIHRLLQVPGVEVHVLDLEALGLPGGARPPEPTGDDLHVSTGPRQPIVDDAARRRYQLRIEDLRDQIEEAEATNDPERAARAREELDRLMEELATTFGSRGSRSYADETERARVNVYRAIRKAIEKIREEDPSLGHHLDHDIRTGTYCSYSPDPTTAPDWAL